MRWQNILSFSFPLTIVMAFLGRGLFNITFFLSLVIFLSIIKKNDIKKIFAHSLVKGWGVFLITVFIANLFSEYTLFSMKKYFNFLFYSLISVSIGIYLYLISEQKSLYIKRAIIVLGASLFIMEAITILNVLLGFDVLHFIKKFEKVPQAGNYHLREVFVAMSFFLVYDYVQRKETHFYLKIIFLIIPVLGILASTSRTAIVTIVVSLIIYHWIKFKKLLSKEIMVLISLLVGITSVSYVLFPEIKTRLDSFKTTFLLEGGDRMSGRYDVYKDSIEKIQKRPITGYGVKFAAMDAKKGNSLGSIAKHPHNIFLEILLDSGIIGLLGFLYFVYILFKDKFIFKEPVVVATFTSIFLTSLVSWSIWSANHISLVLLIITLMLGYVLQFRLQRN